MDIVFTCVCFIMVSECVFMYLCVFVRVYTYICVCVCILVRMCVCLCGMPLVCLYFCSICTYMHAQQHVQQILYSTSSSSDAGPKTYMYLCISFPRMSMCGYVYSVHMYEMEYESYLLSFLQFHCRSGLPIGSEMTGVVSGMSYAYAHHIRASSVITTVPSPGTGPAYQSVFLC